MNHYVYLIVNNINNKKYIGKRSCSCPIEQDNYMGSGKALKQAQKKYGIDNFTKHILLVCDSEEQAYIEEEKAIELAGAVESDRYYNICSGGKGVRGYKISEQHKQILREKMAGDKNPFYGKRHNRATKEKLRKLKKGMYIGKNNPRARNVICLNTLEEFDTLKQAGEKTKTSSTGILNACKNKNNTAGRHSITGEPLRWMYLDDYKEKISHNLANKENKKIICLNTQEVFEYYRMACEKYNIKSSHLLDNCRGKRKSAGKINNEKAIWMYYENYIKYSKEEINQLVHKINKGIKGTNNHKAKSVICLNTLEVFEYIKLVEDTYNIHKTAVSAVCRGKRKSAGKHPETGEKLVWMYLEDYENKYGAIV